MNTNLYVLREYHNLYQKDIAKILNIHERTYSSWETGSKIIPLKHLVSLCSYYKVSLDYAMNLSKEKNYKNVNSLQNLNKKEIGERIKIIREDNHLTLRDLAKVLNTTSSTISAYETGKTLILTAFAIQLGKVYNISLDWLCGLSNQKYIK